jgi:glycosyltransferase involved in cell wall biosynthesis
MSNPKVCVVIPTRERADTLFSTLQSCVDQDYENLEILICDNFSQDNTHNVVTSFIDPRIRYVNPGQRLSMSENWEYALSQVEADYVTVMGDDDGFLPHAISDLVSLMHSHSTSIVTWKKVEYCWPNYLVPQLRNYLSIPLRNRLVEISSSRALRHIYQFRLGYSRGPCIYNSMVSMRHVRDILTRDGKLFQSAIPDVYSSLALASVVDSYLYSSRPFSINGASAHSNGTASTRPNVDQTASKLFLSEYARDEVGFKNIQGSITAAVTDALVQFSKCAITKTPDLSFRHVFRRIMSELKAWPDLLKQNHEVLNILAQRYGYSVYVERLYRDAVERTCEPTSGVSAPPLTIDGDNVLLWGDRFMLSNVHDASKFASKVLGKYVPPTNLGKYSLSNALFSKLISRTQNLDRYLGL